MDYDRRQIVLGAGWTFLASIAAAREARGLGEKQREKPAADRPTRIADRAILVLHVERDFRRSFDLGHLLGTFLLRGQDDDVVLLDGCELRAATTSELRALVPELPEIAKPRAIVLGPGGTLAGSIVEDPPRIAAVPYNAPSERDLEVEKSVLVRHAWFAKQLRPLLALDRAAIEQRARLERERLGIPPQSGLARQQIAKRWPCWVRDRAELDPANRKSWFAALAIATRERWKVTPPQGATWADDSFGCGPDYRLPDGRSVAGPCGTGYVPAVSRRFLHFYTAEERTIGSQPRDQGPRGR